MATVKESWELWFGKDTESAPLEISVHATSELHCFIPAPLYTLPAPFSALSILSLHSDISAGRSLLIRQLMWEGYDSPWSMAPSVQLSLFSN